MIAIGLVALKVRQVWEEDQEVPSKPVKRKAPSGVLEAGQSLGKPQLASTESIVKQNLFDPQRGGGEQGDAGDSSQGMEKLRDLVLLGTVIDGSERYAIVEFPPENKPRARRAKRLARTAKGKRLTRAGRRTRGEVRRLALGDTVEGFKLVEVHAQRVVFEKGSSTVELVLDFSRKVKVEKVKEKVKVPKKAQKVQKTRARRRAKERSPEAATAP